MSKAIKVKLDQLYKVDMASEVSPAHYTPATVEIFDADSAVTIRATTNPDYEGGYADLPVATDEAVEGEIYQCDLTRSVRFISFSCSDTSAEIYVAGFKMEEIDEPETTSEPEGSGSGSEEPGAGSEEPGTGSEEPGVGDNGGSIFGDE